MLDGWNFIFLNHVGIDIWKFPIFKPLASHKSLDDSQRNNNVLDDAYQWKVGVNITRTFGAKHVFLRTTSENLWKIFEITTSPFFVFLRIFLWQNFLQIHAPTPTSPRHPEASSRSHSVLMLTIDRQVESDGVGTIWFFHQNVLCFERCWWYFCFETKETEGWRLKEVESLWEKVRKDLITVCLVYVLSDLWYYDNRQYDIHKCHVCMCQKLHIFTKNECTL